MAIQMRRGQSVDFDPTKMLTGEWAVSIDNETQKQMVYMCFAPGVVKRMATLEDFQNELGKVAVFGITDDGYFYVQTPDGNDLVFSTDDDTLYYGMNYEQFLILRLAGDEQKIDKMQKHIDELEDKFSRLCQKLGIDESEV